MQITANEAEIIKARLNLFATLGLDAKRGEVAWQVYGYPESIGFDKLLAAYERHPAAHGAVHKLLDKCWQDVPRIKRPEDDEESAFEDAIHKLMRGFRGWAKLRDFDRRNMIGRYAGLIYRVADGLELREPLTGGKLVDLVPLYEDQLKVTAWDADPKSPTYGMPRMYQYRTRPVNVEDTQGRPEEWVDVHPSRVQILAEGSVGDMFDGVPLLKAGFNSLVDLEKVTGGSAESFLKNSARTVVYEFDPTASPQAIATDPSNPGVAKSVREVFSDQTKELNRNQDAAIVLQGGKANTLQTAQSDPGPSFGVASAAFAASVRIPQTILFGQQTGRLASDEDRSDFNERAKSRRENELTPMLEEFVRRMQAIGAIEQGDFEVEWKPLDVPGDAEKADVLGKLTAAMQQASSAGLTEPLFDANELRGVMDYEPRSDDGMPTAEDLAAAQAAEEAAMAAKPQPKGKQ